MYDRANHSGLFFKLRDVGVGGAVFIIIAGFFSGRVQKSVIDGVGSEDVRMVFGAHFRIVCFH